MLLTPKASSSDENEYISKDEMHLALTQISVIQDCYILLSSMDNISSDDSKILKQIEAMYYELLSLIVTAVNEKIKNIIDEKTKPLQNINTSLTAAINIARSKLNDEFASLLEEKNPTTLFIKINKIIENYIKAIEEQKNKLAELDENAKSKLDTDIKTLKESLSSENILILFTKEDSEHVKKHYIEVCGSRNQFGIELAKGLIANTSISKSQSIYLTLLESVKVGQTSTDVILSKEEIALITEIINVELLNKRLSELVSSLIIKSLHRLKSVGSILYPTNLAVVRNFIGSDADELPFLNATRMLYRLNKSSVEAYYQLWNYYLPVYNLLTDILRSHRNDNNSDSIDKIIPKLDVCYQLSLRIVMPRNELLNAIKNHHDQLQVKTSVSTRLTDICNRMSYVSNELSENTTSLRQLSLKVNAFKAAYEFIAKIDKLFNTPSTNIPDNISQSLKQIKKYLFDTTNPGGNPSDYKSILTELGSIYKKYNINIEDLRKIPVVKSKDSEKFLLEIAQRYIEYYSTVNSDQPALLESDQNLEKKEQRKKRATELNLLGLLDITPSQLKMIVDVNVRARFIKYKFLLAQLEYAYDYQEPEKKKNILEKLQKAYDALIKTYCNDQNNNSISMGLTDLGSIDRATDLIHICDKQDGVEPGFEAGLLLDIIECLEREYPNLEERIQYFCQFNGDYLKLYEALQDKIDKYLIKFDYSLNPQGFAVPNAENLKRTKLMQQFFQWSTTAGNLAVEGFKAYKTDTPTNINVLAVREVLTNDLARASGMQVQDQTLVLDTYENGALKVMTKGTWIVGARALPIPKENTHTESYCVTKTLWCPEGISYTVNHSIKNLPWYFAVFVVNADWDSIGSAGQNKLLVKNEFIGIDFGHAFEKVSPLIALLTTDFHLPISKQGSFSNYSIFSDYTKRELFQGLLIQAKLAGIIIPDEVIKQYGEEFQRKYNSIEKNGLNKVFDDYITKFKFYLQHCPDSHQKDYQAIIDKIVEIKGIANESLKSLVKKFEKQLPYPPVCHDIIENIHKIFASPDNTTLRSADGRVMLSHLRFLDESKVLQWQVEKRSNGYHFFATCESVSQADAVFEKMKQFITLTRDPKNKKCLVIICKVSELDQLATQLSEELIINKYHENDAGIRKTLNIEKVFLSDIDAFNQLDLGVNLNLCSSEDSYQLFLQEAKEFNPNVLMLLQNHLQEPSSKNHYDFAPDKIEFKHQSFKKFLKELDVLIEIEKIIAELKSKFGFVIQFLINKDGFCVFKDASGSTIKTVYTIKDAKSYIENVWQEQCDLVEKAQIDQVINQLNENYKLNLTVQLNKQANSYEISGLPESLKSFASCNRPDVFNQLNEIDTCLQLEKRVRDDIQLINDTFKRNTTCEFDWEKNECTLHDGPKTLKIVQIPQIESILKNAIKKAEYRAALLQIETRMKATIDDLNKTYSFNIMIEFSRANGKSEFNIAKISNVPLLIRGNEIWYEKTGWGREPSKIYEIRYKDWETHIADLLETIKYSGELRRLNNVFNVGIYQYVDFTDTIIFSSPQTYLDARFSTLPKEKSKSQDLAELHEEMLVRKKAVEDICKKTKLNIQREYQYPTEYEIKFFDDDFHIDITIKNANFDITHTIKDFVIPKNLESTLQDLILQEILKMEVTNLESDLSKTVSTSSVSAGMFNSVKGYFGEFNATTIAPVLQIWLKSDEPYSIEPMKKLRDTLTGRITHVESLMKAETDVVAKKARHMEVERLAKIMKVITILSLGCDNLSVSESKSQNALSTALENNLSSNRSAIPSA